MFTEFLSLFEILHEHYFIFSAILQSRYYYWLQLWPWKINQVGKSLDEGPTFKAPAVFSLLPFFFLSAAAEVCSSDTTTLMKSSPPPMSSDHFSGPLSDFLQLQIVLDWAALLWWWLQIPQIIGEWRHGLQKMLMTTYDSISAGWPTRFQSVVSRLIMFYWTWNQEACTLILKVSLFHNKACPNFNVLH